jgi:cytochrome c biogenesis protein CcdA
MGYSAPLPITDVMSVGITVASLCTLLIAIVAEYRTTREGIRRLQFKPVAFGTGVWIVFFLIGILFGFVIEDMFSNEGTLAWLKMAE